MLQSQVDSEQQVASSYSVQEGYGKADGPLQWKRGAILTLINLYCERREDFTNPRIKVKQIWETLSGELQAQGFQVTPQQVETKWRGLMSTFKKIKDWNSKLGNNARHWEYYSVMQDALGLQPQISAAATCSTSGGLKSSSITSSSVEKSSESCTPSQPSSSSRKRKQETVVDVVNKIFHELQERRRERKEERKAVLDVLKTMYEKL